MMVLDSSAILAFFLNEPGAEMVVENLRGAALSTINLAEIVTRLAEHGLAQADIRNYVDTLYVDIHPFGVNAALATGFLRQSTRAFGLSLGDRACLALARELGRPVLTADRAWAKLDIGVEVRLIRD